jgi:hypothetical protein
MELTGLLSSTQTRPRNTEYFLKVIAINSSKKNKFMSSQEPNTHTRVYRNCPSDPDQLIQGNAPTPNVSKIHLNFCRPSMRTFVKLSVLKKFADENICMQLLFTYLCYMFRPAHCP